MRPNKLHFGRHHRRFWPHPRNPPYCHWEILGKFWGSISPPLNVASEGAVVWDSIHQALSLVYLIFPPRWSCCNTSLGICKSFMGYLCFLRLFLDLIICKPAPQDPILRASTLAGFPKKPAQWWEFRHYSGLWVSGLLGYYQALST